MTTTAITQLVMSIFSFAIGIFALIKVIQRSRRIDTESIAEVVDVQDLGHSGVKKVYAIKYEVKASTPFNIYETPCKKQRKLGTQRTIFYEESDPKNNFYFKTLGQFDKRIIFPIAIICCGIILLIGMFSNVLN